ncbi:carboxylesterase/lipase family protein [Acidipropionibacterium jensenii]|uniref:Carboxylic ester hydrolase n=2 Tax=Acidipropionibacterium jensenii TaxID=1749 RepID=A0A3Q9UIM3_9ACTN|nr:carboxylesterase/lipase family protein [Acidipropionibacterium jensenii]
MRRVIGCRPEPGGSTINPTVMTAQGPVVGVDQGATRAWYALPYAAPPLGPLRFRRPSPPLPHREPLDAGRWGPAPVQRLIDGSVSGFGGTAVAEDCLTLDVVRPSTDRAESDANDDVDSDVEGDVADGAGLPVLVWIHGGAFMTGTGSTYDARGLAEAGRMIVVTLNYRVGPFGFLDLSSLSTPGVRCDSNVGLFDQITALKWVQANIAAFGGDPGNVTLAGQSAGGTSVLALLCMPAARGLFARAVAQSPAPAMGLSGAVHAGWAHRFADLLRARVGADTATALATASPDQLLDAMDELHAISAARCPDVSILCPCIDRSLPAPILEAFETGRQAAVGLLIGTNRDEDGLAPGPYDESAAAELRAWHLTVVRTAVAHGRRAPTWMYRFDHVSADPRIGPRGAAHSQELRYLFGTLPADSPDRDSRFSSMMQRLWSRFAADGRPAESRDWPTYRADRRRIMVLDDDPAVICGA